MVTRQLYTEGTLNKYRITENSFNLGMNTKAAE